MIIGYKTNLYFLSYTFKNSVRRDNPLTVLGWEWEDGEKTLMNQFSFYVKMHTVKFGYMHNTLEASLNFLKIKARHTQNYLCSV